MILAAAVCPHPPMIIPAIASGAADDLAALRSACDAAVSVLLGRGAERIVVLGTGDLAADSDESAGGTFAAYGLDLHVGGPGSDLPLSLAVGAWLLDRAGWSGPRTYSTGVPDADGAALLVMADGSAKRSTTAPGFLDERAEAFDASIAAALAAGDAEALAALDVELGAELWAAGVPALRTLGELAKGADIVANLRVDVAPFGVGYWVADWVLS
ncbi:hypothetical protein ASC61_18605 [Aeromicrobium sp. Root344]|uniref:hypothetical protein n=1 Tax=Aeromicrobium sp. Root344 TaxID=1736521 RepID=UPI0006F7F5A7|nr:hypothetical protein [Aeromicrobium sp. Root344]KQV76847.1 hypothetical protein ASC61_18605 [Aeromicrobium sp. Root344]